MTKILITGSDGFIGSHLTEQLVRAGNSVKAFVLYNSFNTWGWLDSLPKEILSEIEIFQGDIRDPNGVKQAMKGMDEVFHLAALIAIPFSYHSPDTYVDTNIKGTLNVLQAARELGTSRVLVTSTSEVYGTAQYVPIDESHPFQGQSPYSATKIGADRLAESFYRSFGTPVTIVRPFNTFGPRQSMRAVIPTIIAQALDGHQIRLGDLRPVRDFNFVTDTATGFIAAASGNCERGETFNLATGRGVSIGETVEIIGNLLGKKLEIIEEENRLRPPDSEVMRLVGNADKAAQQLGWRPQHPLEEGLRQTVEWLKNHRGEYQQSRQYHY